jgi:hypothetical protein
VLENNDIGRLHVGAGSGGCLCRPPCSLSLSPKPTPPRALPLFDASTVVQHYLRPEEMRPFHAQVMESLLLSEGSGGGGGDEQQGSAAARGLYDELVRMGLLRR